MKNKIEKELSPPFVNLTYMCSDIILLVLSSKSRPMISHHVICHVTAVTYLFIICHKLHSAYISTTSGPIFTN